MWTLAADCIAEGADIWILPEPEESKFSREIEMKLGFPYANWKARPTQQRSESLLTWTDPSFEFRCASGAPLVVPSADRVNCQWVVFLPIVNHTPDSWLKECQKIVNQLNTVNPRLWIPASWKEELLKAELNPVGSYCEYN